MFREPAIAKFVTHQQGLSSKPCLRHRDRRGCAEIIFVERAWSRNTSEKISHVVDFR